MSPCLSTEALAELVGRDPETIRRHIRRRWLKAEKLPGVNGYRIHPPDAQAWAALYLAQDLPLPAAASGTSSPAAPSRC